MTGQANKMPDVVEPHLPKYRNTRQKLVKPQVPCPMSEQLGGVVNHGQAFVVVVAAAVT